MSLLAKRHTYLGSDAVRSNWLLATGYPPATRPDFSTWAQSHFPFLIPFPQNNPAKLVFARQNLNGDTKMNTPISINGPFQANFFHRCPHRIHAPGRAGDVRGIGLLREDYDLAEVGDRRALFHYCPWRIVFGKSKSAQGEFLIFRH